MKIHALRADRFTLDNQIELYALVHRLDEIISNVMLDQTNRKTGSSEWRKSYDENVREFLSFFDATTPDIKCRCDKKF